VLRNIVPQKPDGIVTAALDVNAPVPVLKRRFPHPSQVEAA